QWYGILRQVTRCSNSSPPRATIARYMSGMLLRGNPSPSIAVILVVRTPWHGHSMVKGSSPLALIDRCRFGRRSLEEVFRSTVAGPPEYSVLHGHRLRLYRLWSLTIPQMRAVSLALHAEEKMVRCRCGTPPEIVRY